MISISGVFAVTFSVVFAYVADVTDESERSAAYGLVSFIIHFFFSSSPIKIQCLCLFLIFLNVMLMPIFSV